MTQLLCPQLHRRRGMVLFLTFLLMLVLAGLATAIGVFSHNSQMRGKTMLLDQQAAFIAEAGVQRARQALAAATWLAVGSPGNTYTESFGAGEYVVTIVDQGSNSYDITSAGYVPSQASPVAQRQITATAVAVTANDGTNYSLTSSASASSTNGSNAASNAIDGDNNTKWQANTKGNGEWLKLDYGVSPPTLNKLVVLESANIDGVTIEYSNDNAAWTTPGGISIIESPNKTWTATFAGISHRYFRATFTASGSNNRVSVKEMQSYNSSITALGAGTTSLAW